MPPKQPMPSTAVGYTQQRQAKSCLSLSNRYTQHKYWWKTACYMLTNSTCTTFWRTLSHISCFFQIQLAIKDLAPHLLSSESGRCHGSYIPTLMMGSRGGAGSWPSAHTHTAAPVRIHSLLSIQQHPFPRLPANKKNTRVCMDTCDQQWNSSGNKLPMLTGIHMQGSISLHCLCFPKGLMNSSGWLFCKAPTHTHTCIVCLLLHTTATSSRPCKILRINSMDELWTGPRNHLFLTAWSARLFNTLCTATWPCKLREISVHGLRT